MRAMVRRRRLSVDLDYAGNVLGGAVNWYDVDGGLVESLALGVGPFDDLPGYIQVLADQKPRSWVDKKALF